MHLFDYFETENNYYLVINHCNKGDLETYLQKQKIRFLDERDAIEVLKQIMNGFIELRKYKVMHRDLKLSNIFLHNEKIVIGDFGLAKTGKEMSCTKLGTPLMMAPELIEGAREYSSKTDLWSIGILFYQLLFGTVPFFGLSLNEVYAEIEAKSGDKLKFPNSNPISAKTQHLLRSLLQMDPDKRTDWKDFFYADVFNQNLIPAQINSMKSLQSIEIDNPNNITDYTLHHNSPVNVNSSPSINKLHKPTYDSNFDTPVQQKKSKKFDAILNTIKSLELIQHQKVDTSPVKFRSVILMNDVIKALNRDELIQENSYRYCHELNKVSFLISTCKRIIDYVVQNSFIIDQAKFLLPAIIGVFNLGYLKCTTIYDSLVARENIYELYEFEKLYRSERYEQLIDYYSRYLLKLKTFKKRMLDNNELTVLLGKYQLIGFLNDNMKENEVRALLLASTKGIHSYFYCDNSTVAHKDHELLLISVFIALSLKLREMFPYWIANKKFKWDNFVVNYENMNSQKLLEIVKIAIDNECK